MKLRTRVNVSKIKSQLNIFFFYIIYINEHILRTNERKLFKKRKNYGFVQLKNPRFVCCCPSIYCRPLRELRDEIFKCLRSFRWSKHEMCSYCQIQYRSIMVFWYLKKIQIVTFERLKKSQKRAPLNPKLD